VEAGVDQIIGLIKRDQQGDKALSKTEATKGPKLFSQSMGTNIRRKCGILCPTNEVVEYERNIITNTQTFSTKNYLAFICSFR
jgi:hypothetical protein